MVYKDVSVQPPKIKSLQSNKGDAVVVWCTFIIGNSSHCAVKADSYHVIHQKKNEKF